MTALMKFSKEFCCKEASLPMIFKENNGIRNCYRYQSREEGARKNFPILQNVTKTIH